MAKTVKAKPSKKVKASTRKSASHSASAREEGGSLREHVLYLLRGGGAHVDFDKAIADLPAKQRGSKVPGVPFTAWGLLEHMRIAQWDILEFSRNPKHTSPPWPAGYWPGSEAPPNAKAWDGSVARFRADLRAMEKLVADPETDLHAKIPHGEGQTILREALLIADHNAYHLGQLVMLRRLLGAWPD
jgi:DinB superfamily